MTPRSRVTCSPHWASQAPVFWGFETKQKQFRSLQQLEKLLNPLWNRNWLDLKNDFLHALYPLKIEKWPQKIPRAVKLACMMLQWWTQVIIHLSRPIHSMTPRENPDVNCGPWVVMKCVCKFISCDKCALGCGMPTVGELCMHGGGRYMELCIFCSILPWN